MAYALVVAGRRIQVPFCVRGNAQVRRPVLGVWHGMRSGYPPVYSQGECVYTYIRVHLQTLHSYTYSYRTRARTRILTEHASVVRGSAKTTTAAWQARS